jgi:hypothetical protein
MDGVGTLGSARFARVALARYGQAGRRLDAPRRSRGAWPRSRSSSRVGGRADDQVLDALVRCPIERPKGSCCGEAARGHRAFDPAPVVLTKQHRNGAAPVRRLLRQAPGRIPRPRDAARATSPSPWHNSTKLVGSAFALSQPHPVLLRRGALRRGAAKRVDALVYSRGGDQSRRWVLLRKRDRMLDVLSACSSAPRCWRHAAGRHASLSYGRGRAAG